jgi:hypothetical protein
MGVVYKKVTKRLPKVYHFSKVFGFSEFSINDNKRLRIIDPEGRLFAKAKV